MDTASNVLATYGQNQLAKSLLREIQQFLETQRNAGELKAEIFEAAISAVPNNLWLWLTDEKLESLSVGLRSGILEAVEDKRWDDLTEAFIADVAFGTGGIRGIAAFTEKELVRIKEEGIQAPILKGPNTINDIVFLKMSAGVARYARDKNLTTIVIGYDSRVRGEEFAYEITKLFLAQGLKVYLFDEASPYPELAFAVPSLKADLGVLISASHNDRRYNGYKLCAACGSQLNLAQRNEIFENYISKVNLSEIERVELENLKDGLRDKLVLLGGERLANNNELFSGLKLINMHCRHANHVNKFILMDKKELQKLAGNVSVAYCAFHGVGRKVVPRLLKHFGFKNLRIIKALHELDGMFPAFDQHPEQQPDPGDIDAAEIALENLKKEYPQALEQRAIDIVIGTDPDADRAGIIVQVPPSQRKVYYDEAHPLQRDYTLLSADDAWTLLLWYRLHIEAARNNGVVPDHDKKFIVLSHVTTDALAFLARKYGLGVVKTFVGFAMIADAVSRIWRGEELSAEINPELIYDVIDMSGKRRSFNVGAFEQSNGFSIFGGKPRVENSLGRHGHVRDKDGTLAAILLAEVVAYAKAQGTTILELLDEKVYLDPEIGCFITYYEPAPRYGQYKGLRGISDKIRVLDTADHLFKEIQGGKKVELGGMRVRHVERYHTGKYDALHWKEGPPADEGFPDEGIRFFLDDAKLNHFTIRPSGTSQCLRLHVQLKVEGINRQNLIKKKLEARNLEKSIISQARLLLEVPT